MAEAASIRTTPSGDMNAYDQRHSGRALLENAGKAGRRMASQVRGDSPAATAGSLAIEKERHRHDCRSAGWVFRNFIEAEIVDYGPDFNPSDSSGGARLDRFPPGPRRAVDGCACTLAAEDWRESDARLSR